MHNKIIVENTKTRAQTILVESEVRLSTLARSTGRDFLIAAAEGEINRTGNANIYLINGPQNKLQNKITFFQQGVQSMAFSNCGRFLLAASIKEEGCFGIFDVHSGLVVENGTVSLPAGTGLNKIVVNPSSDPSEVDFCTVGQNGHFQIWKYDPEQQDLLTIRPEMNHELQSTNFTCATFTPRLPAPYNGEIIMLGTSDGAVVAVNPNPRD